MLLLTVQPEQSNIFYGMKVRSLFKLNCLFTETQRAKVLPGAAEHYIQEKIVSNERYTNIKMANTEVRIKPIALTPGPGDYKHIDKIPAKTH